MGGRGNSAPKASREPPKAPNTAKDGYRTAICRSRRSDEISGLSVIAPLTVALVLSGASVCNADIGGDEPVEPSKVGAPSPEVRAIIEKWEAGHGHGPVPASGEGWSTKDIVGTSSLGVIAASMLRMAVSL